MTPHELMSSLGSARHQAGGAQAGGAQAGGGAAGKRKAYAMPPSKRASRPNLGAGDIGEM